MEFSRTRDPAWRREGAEGRILAESERVFPKSGASLTEDDETKIPVKGKGLTTVGGLNNNNSRLGQRYNNNKDFGKY